MVGREGIEPPQSKTADLQSAELTTCSTYPRAATPCDGRRLIKLFVLCGAADGTRTRNRRFTKPLLYQLSYGGATTKDTGHLPCPATGCGAKSVWGQQTLVQTLQGEVVAYERKVNRLDSDFKACKTRLEYVERQNRELKDDVFQLRTDLTNALLKIERPRTRRTRRDDAT